MKDKHSQLAQIMGRITVETLASSDDFISLTRNNPVEFSTRTGSGRATYCKHHRTNREMIITYGKKMIASKLNPVEAVHWLSYREIIKRNYFDGDTSLSNLLSHTICHEFAHALQQIQGLVFKGSIHNAHFYRILDQLHASSLANDVKQELEHLCDQHSISLIYNQPSVAEKAALTPLFRLNDTIQFKHRNKLISARIIKINSKTLTVESKGLFKSILWRVPKHQAQHC